MRIAYVIILITESQQTNIVDLVKLLKKWGHTVIIAKNGKQTLQLFNTHHPDLMIFNLNMKNMDGYTCIKNIRSVPGGEAVPVILFDQSFDDEKIYAGLSVGATDFLTTPFSEAALIVKLNAVQSMVDMREELLNTKQKFYLLSSIDSLTGAYNRLQFDRSVHEMTATADRHHFKLALLIIDLDNFKNINDSFGSQIGDLILREVTKRLKTCLRVNDFIARLGSDEFAVILGIKTNEEAALVAEKILDSIGAIYPLEESNIRVGASIGIACYPDSPTPEHLLQNADIALYHAKVTGRNNFQYFTDVLNDRYQQLISLEHALKFALERQELALNYQPIIDLQSGELVGLETLLTWNHPSYGTISPNVFIPIAEEAGLIRCIGTWVLETAFLQAAKWQLNKFKDFKFAINISSRQLLQEHFFQKIVDLLHKHCISPNQVEFELTETSVMSDTVGPFKQTIKKLSEIGISISIDDFGTGYSSLTRLKHLPIRTLKIEQSFIQEAITDPNVYIIVNCLIALGKNLGMNVIAEGIETKEQLDLLIAIGCPQGQGFILSKPLTAEQMTAFMKEKLSTCIKQK